MSWEREVRYNLMRRRADGDHPAREIRRWRVRCWLLAVAAICEGVAIAILLGARN
jgi:hypothetical protein